MPNVPARDAAVHMTTYRRQPLTLVRGEGTRVWDDEGRSYLDFIAGIAVDSLGHAHPGLTEVIAKQAGTLIQVSNLFYTEQQVELAEMLVKHSALDKAFFCNSGTEANEGAIKLARKWGIANRNGAYEIIATNNGFHGRTLGSVAATGTPRYREFFGPGMPGFVFVDYDDIDAIKAATTPATAAVMLEPIQGEGGVNVPAPDYLKRVREWCDQNGLLLILDEVQTGTGRTGALWAYEHAGIEPDVMTLAKGLGGGVPIGAILAKDHCAIFEPGDHGSTFGGNALASAAATYVLRQLIDGGVLANVRTRGEQLERRLAGLEDRHESVVGQRGAGLMRGVVFDADIAVDVATRAMNHGLLVNPVRPNVVRFLPPLNVTAGEIDAAIDIIDTALTEIASA